MQRICAAHYRIPSRIRLSEECADLLRRIFVVDPSQRIPLRGIKQHPWFLHRDLPDHMQVAADSDLRGTCCTCKPCSSYPCPMTASTARTTLCPAGWERCRPHAHLVIMSHVQDGWGGAFCNGADQQLNSIPSAQTDLQIRQMLQEARQPPFATRQVYQY